MAFANNENDTNPIIMILMIFIRKSWFFLITKYSEILIENEKICDKNVSVSINNSTQL